MSPNELAALCINRWVSSDHVCWLMRALIISVKVPVRQKIIDPI